MSLVDFCWTMIWYEYVVVDDLEKKCKSQKKYESQKYQYQSLHTSIAPLYQNLHQGAKAGGKLFKAPGRAGMWLWQLLISLKGSQRCGALSTFIAKNEKKTVQKKHTIHLCFSKNCSTTIDNGNGHLGAFLGARPPWSTTGATETAAAVLPLQFESRWHAGQKG